MPLPKRTRTHVPGSTRTTALRPPFLAPTLMDKNETPTARTIPRPLPTPKDSEMPRRRRQRREVLPSLAVTPAPADADESVERPSEVDGVAVLREERLTNYQGSFFKISKLFLADNAVVWGCWDCLYVGESRGAVMSHRNADHGSRYGHKRPRVIFEEPAPDVLIEDVILPPREDGSPAPETIMQMTVGEFISLMPTIRALGDTIERLEKQIDALKDEVAQNRVDRSTQHKIDVYETNRAEIIELRQVRARHERCDDYREEVKELRSWRRKMINRMEQLGFKLSDEEN